MTFAEKDWTVLFLHSKHYLHQRRLTGHFGFPLRAGPEMHMHHHHHLESTTVAAAAASIPTHQLSARAEQLRTPAGALSSSGAMRCTAPSSKTDAEMCGDPRILDEKNLDWRLERTLASSSSSSSSPDRRPRDAKKPKAATKRGERAASRRYRKATYYVRKVRTARYRVTSRRALSRPLFVSLCTPLAGRKGGAPEADRKAASPSAVANRGEHRSVQDERVSSERPCECPLARCSPRARVLDC